MSVRYVFPFGRGRTDSLSALPSAARRRQVLGGKGAGLAEMGAAGLPVPPGFTVSCEACALFLAEGRLPEAVERAFDAALAELEERTGQRLGEAARPLLVSVRSGAPRSMPGMMDTVLNLGLTPATVEGLAQRSGDARFAWDAWRRFLASYASIVYRVPRHLLEEALVQVKREEGVESDAELSAEALRQRVAPAFERVIQQSAGRPVPTDAHAQLRQARDAVFGGWNNPRAVAYRRRFNIPDTLGTAVTVQQMVFGNRGARSGTGVGFTRNPASGAPTLYGEFLVNAQGEDVVAGVRTPSPLEALHRLLPEAARELEHTVALLERTYRWPQDFEFTIEEGRFFILQTRDGKSTARAALRWAMDLHQAGLLSAEEALLRVDAASLEQLLLPEFDPRARTTHAPVARGLAAGPGAANGRIVFSAEAAVAWHHRGEKVLLVRPETSADDVAGMIAAEGVLTATGGMTSHAAVVARQLGKPCVVGLSALSVREGERSCLLAGHRLGEGEGLSVDGTSGEVFLGTLPTVDPEVLRGLRGELSAQESELLRDWLALMRLADAHRVLEVRANADRPADAATALQLGARGVGLCRTEHMFFARERLPLMQRLILVAPTARATLAAREAPGQPRPGETPAERAAVEAYQEALARLGALQKEDFKGLLRAMRGLPVTVRTLDPPLHEFLPPRLALVEARALLHAGATPEDAAALEEALRPLAGPLGLPAAAPLLPLVEAVLARVQSLSEVNPMLGHRGCRLGVSYPEVTRMQAGALCEAAAELQLEGVAAHPELMIPLAATEAELAHQRALVEEVVREVARATGVPLALPVGAMVETPRAALTAGALARQAAFFSLGTNDLTQMTFGFSRDDAGRFIPLYLEQRLLPRDPFVALDAEGVGRLVALAVAEGRAARADLTVGLCGEHGGEPDSVALCHRLGLDYVSCSPYRVPCARLAAAQAAIRQAQEAPAPEAPVRPQPETQERRAW